MAHTWIRRPNLVMPPVIERSYFVGNVIRHMENRYVFIGADVRATIEGSLRCDGGQIRNVTTTFRVQVMIPFDILLMVMGQLAVVWWLKAFWWGARGVTIVGGILQKEAFIERKIQEYLDSTNLICLGQFDLSANALIEIDEEIWLDQYYRPMIVRRPDRTHVVPSHARRFG